MNLTLTELLQVSIAVANALPQANQNAVDQDALELAKLEREFEAKKAEIKAKKGFGA